jgi:hypothetical protein
MTGGQILIIFVGGDAFEIVRLNGKEWGLSIGLGAISVSWGAVIRLRPDEWIAACLQGSFVGDGSHLQWRIRRPRSHWIRTMSLFDHHYA